MKRNIYFLTMIAIVLVSCDPLQDINDELEGMDKGYKGTFTYVLSSDDYSDIADLALEEDPADAANAAFISANEFFNMEVKAADYIPMLIPEIYPALGIGSSGVITYNFSEGSPEDLSKYTGATEYKLPEGAYTSIDEVLDNAKYFSPNYPPEVYIPGILEVAIASPASGDLLLVEYMYSDVDPVVDLDGTAEEVKFIEGFTEQASGLGQFTATSVVGDQVWGWGSFSSDTYAKMSGFTGSAVANEDWLVSPAIDLTGNVDASLHINQAINFLGGQWEQIKVLISNDYNGSDIAGATWNEVTVPNLPSGGDWTFVASGAIDISSYVDQTIHIAFKYLSSDSNAATWEVAEVKVMATTTGSISVIGKKAEKYKDFYAYNGSSWEKASEVYHVNVVDYDAMGSPGQYNNFSDEDDPADYVPNLLSEKFPLAGPEVEMVVVYQYYDGSTKTLASRYTFTNGEWEAPADYISRSDQFIRGSTGWVFDPTITFKMTPADYQTIVDYVSDNVGTDYVDSYGTGESYYGAGAYYVNFDSRTTNYASTVFESWEDCVTEAIGKVLLPLKFPDAETQVNGIDMYYIVEFEVYGPYAGDWSIKFQVTKSGPDPEFTLIEGPY